MYRDNAALQSELAEIYIAPISGTEGIDLRNRLTLAWNATAEKNAKYKLAVSLGAAETKYKGLEKSGAATWEEVRMSAAWTLAEGDKRLAAGTASGAESYSFVSDMISANAAKAKAVQNVIRQIGEKIEMSVNARLKGK